MQKIRELHFERLLIIYIRQSSAYAVRRNPESSERQYSLAKLAVELGWHKSSQRLLLVVYCERIEDGDGGKVIRLISARGAVTDERDFYEAFNSE